MIAFAALEAVADEWHQRFVSGRSGNDLGDIAADITGACVGAVVAVLLLTRTRRTS